MPAWRVVTSPPTKITTQAAAAVRRARKCREGTKARRHEGTKGGAWPSVFDVRRWTFDIRIYLRAYVPSCLRAFPNGLSSPVLPRLRHIVSEGANLPRRAGSCIRMGRGG